MTGFSKTILALALLTTGCGGDDGGTTKTIDNPPSSGTPRWAKTAIGSGDQVAMSVTDSAIVDVIYQRGGSIFHSERSGESFVGSEIDVLMAGPSTESDRTVDVVRDNAGVVHAVWQDGDAGDSEPTRIRYAVRTNTTWQVETVATDGFTPIVQVSDDGTPHIAYLEPSHQGNSATRAMLAVRDGIAWRIHNAGEETDYLLGTVLGFTLSPEGVPQFAYIAYPDRELTWVTVQDGTAQKETVAERPARLAADRMQIGYTAQGAAYIAHDGNADLTVLTKIETNWRSETFINTPSDSQWALAHSPAGERLLIRSDESDVSRGMVFRNLDQKSFQRLTIDCALLDVAATAEGIPFVVGQCPGAGALVLYERVGTYSEQWETQCDTATEAICSAAADCTAEGFSIIINGTIRTGNCEGRIRNRLCGNPTQAESKIEPCASATVVGMCVGDSTADGSFEVIEACVPDDF